MDRRLPALHEERATLPAELITEFCDADFGPDTALSDDLDVAVPRSMPASIDLWTLTRFKQLMLVEGWPVQTARMLFDRVYAHERLAFGHTSATEELRRLSIDIFRRMHEDDRFSH